MQPPPPQTPGLGATQSLGQPPQGGAMPFNLNTPSLLNWAKDQHLQHEHSRMSDGPFNFFDQSSSLGRSAFDDGFGPPPARGAPGMLHGGPGSGGGPGPELEELGPPPPRSAPAASFFDDSNYDNSRGGGGGGARQQVFSLTVLTSDSRWETFSFSTTDDLDKKGSMFLAEKRLKAAFHSGLVAKMRNMVTMGETQSSVDIVDLL